MTVQYKIVTNENNPLCGKTHNEVLELVKKNWLYLIHIDDQTIEICLAAIKQSYEGLKLIRNQTIDICKIAIEEDIRAVRFIDYSLHKGLGIELVVDYFCRHFENFFKIHYYNNVYVFNNQTYTFDELLKQIDDIDLNKETRNAIFNILKSRKQT